MLTTIERIIFLKGVPLFAQIPGEALVRVAQLAQEITIPPDEVFIQQGNLGDCLFILITGEARITVDEVRQVATLGAKDMIGEMAILSSRLRTASAIATTEITALKIEREEFHILLTEKPELALGIIHVLTQRLENAIRKVD